MARVVNFEGQQHSFPDDASDDEIRQALSGAPQGGVAGAGDEVSRRFDKGFSLTDPSLIGAAGSVYRGAKSLFNDASDLGAGKVNLSSTEGADKGVGVAASVLPMSPAATAGRIVTKAARPPAAPSREALGAAADADHAAGRASGLQVDPASTAGLADKMHAELMGEGYDPLNHPAVFRAIDRLRQGTGQTVDTMGVPESAVKASTINDIDAGRKMLGRVGEDYTQRGATTKATGQLDSYLADIPPEDVVAGDAGKTSQLFRNFRSNYAAGARSDTIQGTIKRADNQASVSGTHSNEANTMKQGANRLVNSGEFVNGEDRLYGFTPEETAAVNDTAVGSGLTNATRTIAKKVGSPFFWGPLAAGAGAAAESGHIVPAALAMGAGYGLHRAAGILARRPMRALDEATRARSALGEAMPPQPGKGVMLNPNASPVAAMISGLTARNRDQ